MTRNLTEDGRRMTRNFTGGKKNDQEPYRGRKKNDQEFYRDEEFHCDQAVRRAGITPGQRPEEALRARLK